MTSPYFTIEKVHTCPGIKCTIKIEVTSYNRWKEKCDGEKCEMYPIFRCPVNGLTYDWVADKQRVLP